MSAPADTAGPPSPAWAAVSVGAAAAARRVRGCTMDGFSHSSRLNW